MKNWAEGLRMEGVMGGEGVKQFLGPSRMAFTSLPQARERKKCSGSSQVGASPK